MNLDVRNLGTGVPYEEALALQQELVAQRILQKIPDTLLLLEHAPVYTIGRTRDKSSLLEPSSLPHAVHEVSRGGQATYHGPGQLVGYPIIDLSLRGKDLHAFLRALESSLIRFCEHFQASAHQRESLTGIWVEERKLASIGVGVKKWITYHGFALNLRSESLPPFQAITPCGLSGVSMTCLTNEGSPSLNLKTCAEVFPSLFQQEVAKLT